MAVEFYLIPNHLSGNDGEYMAVSRNSRTYTIEDVYDHITREGSTITKAEALALFEEFTRGITDIAGRGHAVNTPLVNIKSSVNGVFNGEGDTFDPGRHTVRVNVSAGKRLRAVNGNIPARKVAARERRPDPVHYYDHESDTNDRVITPGGGARITGRLLKFDESDQNQGVFFENTDDGSQVRVESSMLRNKPGELIFVNPELEPGTYKLQVRSILQFVSGIRTGELSDDLTVAGQRV